MSRTLALSALSLAALSACTPFEQHDTVLVNEPIHAVRVQVDDGDVTILAGEAGPVRVEQHLVSGHANPAFSHVEVVDGTLVVTASCDTEPLWICSANHTVFVPTDVSALVNVGWGDVEVAGLRGELAVETGAGDIDVRDVKGVLTLETHAGDVSLRTVEGQIYATSSAGDVVGEHLVSERVVASTAAGDVDLAFLEPGGVDATTGAGDIDLLLPAGAYALDLDTGAGDIAVVGVIDEASAFPVHAYTGAGDVRVVGE